MNLFHTATESLPHRLTIAHSKPPATGEPAVVSETHDGRQRKKKNQPKAKHFFFFFPARRAAAATDCNSSANPTNNTPTQQKPRGLDGENAAAALYAPGAHNGQADPHQKATG